MKYILLLLVLSSTHVFAGSIYTPSQQTQMFLNDRDERAKLYQKQESDSDERSGPETREKVSDSEVEKK